MNVDNLLKEIRARGISVLAVAAHPKDRDVAVVYLHGPDGHWIDGHATRIIGLIPGVRNASASVRTPAIVLAWLEPDSDRPPAQTRSAPAAPAHPVFRPEAFRRSAVDLASSY